MKDVTITWTTKAADDKDVCDIAKVIGDAFSFRYGTDAATKALVAKKHYKGTINEITIDVTDTVKVLKKPAGELPTTWDNLSDSKLRSLSTKRLLAIYRKAQVQDGHARYACDERGVISEDDRDQILEYGLKIKCILDEREHIERS